MKGEPDILIIKGAPGSGKSQTSKSLAKFFPKGARIEVDNIRNMITSVDWQNQGEHINMLSASTNLVIDFLKYGFSPVIIVDTFSGDKIKQYIQELVFLDNALSIKVFALFTSDDELRKRLAKRSENEFRDFSICKKLNDDVIKIKEEFEILIDTTGLLPHDTAKIIYQSSLIDQNP
jgi:adenylate kinase family enzyme